MRVQPRVQARPTGVICPVVTPSTKDQEVDGRTLASLVARLVACRTDGVMVAGTTGEFPYLTEGGWRSAVEAALGAAKGMAAIVNVSCPSLGQCVERARFAARCGATHVAATGPVYFPATKQEILRYFRHLAQESPIPVVAYNIPQYSGCDLHPCLEDLADVPGVVGLKDSSGDLSGLAGIMPRLPASFAVVLGTNRADDALRVPGVRGIVPSLGNVLPGLYVAWWRAVVEGRADESAACGAKAGRLLELRSVSDSGVGLIQVVRAALAAADLPVGDPFPPASPTPKALLDLVAAVMHEIAPSLGAPAPRVEDRSRPGG